MKFQVSSFKFQALLLYCSLFIIHYSFSQPEYFQQTVDYNIQLTLNDTSHELNAYETIEYYNNSPSELKEIYFHLWPNAYKNDKTAFSKQELENGSTKFYYSKEDERGYIDQLDFKVNGQNITWKYDSVNIDICKLILNTPLKSGEHITITTPFHVKIPNTFSRLGHVGQSYQITQWYPKPAVYDRYGWHAIPYLNQGEFYSEFGTYDVFITLPKNYVVGATGDLVNGENELIWLEEKSLKTAIIQSYDSKDLAFPPSDKETKTLHYHQEKVHDFAWFADKRFNVLKGDVELPHSKEKITTWAMYTNADGNLWKDAIPYINDAIYYYSLWNGDYAYKQVTALESALSAGGGMEYPNVTVIGGTNSAFGLETVIMHEVGHNWFYGMLGSNERDHAWMDEGLNSYNENRYVATKYPNASLMDMKNKIFLNIFKLKNFKHKDSYYTAYLFSANQNIDQALSIASPKYLAINYGTIVYCKSAIVFDYMRAYLNTSEMDKVMQKYFETWKFKHPYPDDVRYTFKTSTNKNLDWFFTDLLKTTKKLDYKIIHAKAIGDSIQLTLKNTGDIEGPVVVAGMEDGKPTQIKWKDGFKDKQTISLPNGSYSSFKIDPFEEMPEINRNNNTLKAHGICKKFEPLQLQLIGSLNNPNKTQLFYAPVLGYNYHNGFMPGIAVYNHFLFSKSFEFNLMPLYSVKVNDLAGEFNFAKNFNFSSTFFIHKIKLGYKFKRYAFANDEDADYVYEKNELHADISFKKGNPRSSIDKSLTLRNILINNYPELDNSAYLVNDYYSILFQITDKRKINPWKLKLGIEPTSDYIKSSLEALYKISFKGKNKGIDFRLFAGKFLQQSDTYFGNYNFRLSGWNGYRDYLYDNIFLGRYVENENILSQQFVETDGAFKVYTGVGESNDWIAAMNVKLFPPFKLPLGLFADFGMYAGSKEPVYEVGIQLAIVKDVIDIYFPIKVSENMNKALVANGITYLQTIRFTLNFNRLNLMDNVMNAVR